MKKYKLALIVALASLTGVVAGVFVPKATASRMVLSLTEQEASDEADACLNDAAALQTRVNNLLAYWDPMAPPLYFALPHLNALTAISEDLGADLRIED